MLAAFAIFIASGVRMTRWLYGIVGLSAAILAAPSAAQAPNMTREQARALYVAGGFPIGVDGRSPTNRCGRPANPKITFVDINGDRRREALFIDISNCYKPDGRWYAVVTQDADGRWRRVIEGPGSIQANGKIVNGWFAFNVTSAGKTRTMTYNGRAYVPAGTAPLPPAGNAAKLPPPTVSNQPQTMAAPVAPNSAQRDAAIFQAAGLKRIRGQWESGCNDPSSGSIYEPGRIDQVKDLNGDGRPEAIVIEGGSLCYGNTGEAFWLVSQQANGSWKLLYNSVGIAEFLTTKGVGGWPDISIGGPGFCFPVVRWNGSAYVQNRFAYEGKPCRRPAP